MTAPPRFLLGLETGLLLMRMEILKGIELEKKKHGSMLVVRQSIAVSFISLTLG